MNLELVSPSEVFEESLKTYRQEIIEHGESGVPFIVNFDMDDFKAFVNLLAGYSRGEGLREGFVANSTFLLIEDGKEVVGVSNLRHELTPKLEIEGGHIGYGIRPGKRKKGYATYLLQESLKEAKKLGIERALVTCDKGNTASAKTILKNGGVLDSEGFVEERNCVVQRYWIKI